MTQASLGIVSGSCVVENVKYAAEGLEEIRRLYPASHPWQYQLDGVWLLSTDPKKPSDTMIAQTGAFVYALNCDKNQVDWGYLIGFWDHNKNLHKKAFSAQRLVSRVDDFIAELAKEGLFVTDNKKFIDYLRSFKTENRCTVISKIGWGDSSELIYMTPQRAITVQSADSLETSI